MRVDIAKADILGVGDLWAGCLGLVHLRSGVLGENIL